MLTYNIHEAKTHFSKLLESVQHGEEVIIAKSGKPIAVICPIKSVKPKRVRGLLKGKINLDSRFDEPLPKEILEAFEGR